AVGWDRRAGPDPGRRGPGAGPAGAAKPDRCCRASAFRRRRLRDTAAAVRPHRLDRLGHACQQRNRTGAPVRRGPLMTTLRFLGGAGTVTGSKHLITHGDTRILVDCGLFQGMKNLREINWKSLSVPARSIDAVVLTHAHLDHCGYLPRLVRDGFAGRIHLTPATREVAALILRDSAHLQERDAELANRHGFSRHHPAMPLYDEHDAERAIKAFEPVKLHREVGILRGATLTFRRAGHILGAATAQIDIGGRRLVFSGDLGRYDDAVMHDPEPVTEADHVVIESTY